MMFALQTCQSINTTVLLECERLHFLSPCVPHQRSAPPASVSQPVSQRALGSVKKDTLICSFLTHVFSCLSQKEYLKSLGNSECSPQTFLENSSNLDKLLIIIQNEDIAAHVHKVESPRLTLLMFQSVGRVNGILVLMVAMSEW